MPIRSMTGFAQVRGEIQRSDAGTASTPSDPLASNGRMAFALSLNSANETADGEIEAAVMPKVGEALDRLNQMREEEGRGIARELRDRMAHLVEAGKSVQQHRRAVLHNYSERLQSRLQELLGATVDK